MGKEAMSYELRVNELRFNGNGVKVKVRVKLGF